MRKTKWPKQNPTICGNSVDAPEWSLRVSLANLPDDVYDDIGRGVRTIARGYRDAYEASAKGGAR
jgi:aspartate 4-decarboxylase